MRVQVDPQRVELAENSTFTVNVTVTNTGAVIGGYHLRVLGADPSWVTLEAENISLFPDSSQTVRASVEIPPGVGAGDRRIAVQVRELTPPQAIAVAEIELVVPAREAIRLALSPMTVVCGKHGHFSVIAENTGNTSISVAPIGLDPEAKIGFEFLPAVLELAPGEHVITDLRTTAKRRWFGSPVVRPFGLAAVPPDELAAHTAPPGGKPDDQAVTELPAEPPPEPPKPLAQGTLMQKPKLGRGLLSLLSLLLAVSVFATVITIAMSRLVAVSAADRDLAIQVASARSAGAGSGSSVIGGTVKLLAGGGPAQGVTVEVFSAGDLTQPMISTATNDKGAWAVLSMPAGSYKMRFRSAGFAEVWYPNALTGADAKAVQLDAGQQLTKLEVTLGGLPGTISGQVMGADVAGAILTVQVPQQFLQTQTPSATPTAPQTATAQPATEVTNAAVTRSAPPSTGSSESPPGLRGFAAALAPGDGTDTGSGAAPTTAPAGSSGGAGRQDGGVLRTIPIGSDGLFTLDNLPSPAVYDLIVSKAGYATDTQRVDLSGGESRSGVVLVLRTGDGLISGTVMGPDGPLGGAVITATSGSTTIRTLSLTKSPVGGFTLRGLVTPATYTVTVTANGYTTVTSTLSLTSGQRLTGVLLSLSKAAGSLSGTVTTVADGKPAPGVTVTIASGAAAKVATVTQSGTTAGAWKVDGLAIPGTFTITFSRSDLQSQTVSVALNSAGQLTSGAGASGGIDVAMRSAYAVVRGTVLQRTGNGTDPVGEATISLASGEQSYTITSASTPFRALGSYEVAHVQPGTYTLSASSKGTSPTTVIITVAAGQVLTYNPVLIQPASVSGTVTRDGTPLPGTEVDMYLSSQYPGKVYAQTTTGPDGRYSFTGVDAPQAYVVEARSSTEGPLASGTIVLAASQAGVLNLAVGTLTATTSSAAPTTSATPSSSSTAPANSTPAGSSTATSTPTTASSSTPSTPTKDSSGSTGASSSAPTTTSSSSDTAPASSSSSAANPAGATSAGFADQSPAGSSAGDGR
jgi:5-hydroxyisourate hydrolase-like protein (transthyretin family)